MAAGFGGGNSGYFAQLTPGINLTHNDFIVTARSFSLILSLLKA
jgi:hypothetical protein